MDYNEFLNRVIEDGIVSAKADYEGKPNRSEALRGSVDGFEVCRGKTPKELFDLRKRADKTLNHCTMTHDPELKYWQGRRSEIEWVCNVVSAMLENERQPVIVHPTAGGVRKAAEILGILKGIS